jgi:hypothetical protein
MADTPLSPGAGFLSLSLLLDLALTPGAGRLSLTIGELTPGTGTITATGQPTALGKQELGPIPMRRVAVPWRRVPLEPEPPAIDSPADAALRRALRDRKSRDGEARHRGRRRGAAVARVADRR